MAYALLHLRGVRVLSGRVVDLKSNGRWLETYRRHYVVSMSKTLYPVLCTGLTTEESNRPALLNIVHWYVNHQHKYNYAATLF